MRGGKQRLPDLSFLRLPVTHDTVDGVGLAVQLRRHGHALRDAQALSQRPGAGLDGGDGRVVRMSLQQTAHHTQIVEFVMRNHATAREHGVKRGHAMAFRKYQAMPVGIGDILRRAFNPAEEQDGEDIDERKRAAGVSRARLLQHPDNVDPHFVRGPLQRRNGEIHRVGVR